MTLLRISRKIEKRIRCEWMTRVETGRERIQAMGIIKASKLIYDYIRRDENDQVEEVNRAIDGLDLDIKAGDFVAVLGHNGSGKSTFAKQVNGILLPTEGTVWI